MRAALIGLALLGAQAAEAETWTFTWEGAGGYSVRGALSFSAMAASRPIVTAEDVECFEIAGLRDEAPVGYWGLRMKGDETDWRLHFVPSQGAFVVEGLGIDMPQAWNMDGAGTSCGAGGFGLNIGDQAQDLCIDGALIWESQVSPFQPFPATRDDDYAFGEMACRPAMLLGALTD
jgi:hypothetical protein